MRAHHTGRIAALLLCLPLAGAFAQPDADKVCGEGEGLDPCLDANGQTYEQEVHGPSIDDESDTELENEAARVRAETPEQLDETIKEVEEGDNPDDHATMGLPE
jgi:hypothetical protein